MGCPEPSLRPEAAYWKYPSADTLALAAGTQDDGQIKYWLEEVWRGWTGQSSTDEVSCMLKISTLDYSRMSRCVQSSKS